MANPVFEAVRTVLAVRGFQDRPIPDDVMSRIVEVTDRASLLELGALVRTGRYIAEAAAAIVVAYKKDSPYGVSDASRTIQSMILVAWADGVGSNWTGFGGMEGVRKKVGIPESYDVLAVLPFGYPTRQIGKGKKKRKPLSEVVSVEQFGTPLT
jgi:nitroreductase